MKRKTCKTAYSGRAGGRKGNRVPICPETFAVLGDSTSGKIGSPTSSDGRAGVWTRAFRMARASDGDARSCWRHRLERSADRATAWAGDRCLIHRSSTSRRPTRIGGSPCAVGLVRVRDGRPVDEQRWLIRPPAKVDYFDGFKHRLARHYASDGRACAALERGASSLVDYIGGDVVVTHTPASTLA